jgi:hypothetical protein
VVKVIRSTIIEAPTDKVWAVLRDFNGHDRWHPAVAARAPSSCRCERGDDGNLC